MSVSEEQEVAVSAAASPAEIGEYWETHSTADVWDQTEEVQFTVRFARRRVAVDPDVYAQVADYARGRGLVPETVVNLWLAEKLYAVAKAPQREPAGAAEATTSSDCEPANVGE
ncbi:MAG: hypothetical protein ACYC5O_23445 [Anaerolineae bacterium]